MYAYVHSFVCVCVCVSVGVVGILIYSQWGWTTQRGVMDLCSKP